MKNLIVILVGLWVCTGCQYGGDMYITYLVDGGVDDGGLLTDAGDTDSATDTDTDTDTEEPDGGGGDSGMSCIVGDCCSPTGYIYQPEDAIVCAVEVFYRCTGFCGSAVIQQMDAEKFCDGTSDSCGGGLWVGVWEDSHDCNAIASCISSSFDSAVCYFCDAAGCDPGTEECVNQP